MKISIEWYFDWMQNEWSYKQNYELEIVWISKTKNREREYFAEIQQDATRMKNNPRRKAANSEIIIDAAKGWNTTTISNKISIW